MRAKRRAWLRAMGCSLAFFVVGSLVPVWETWDIGPVKPNGDDIATEPASLWGALRHLIEFEDWDQWVPVGVYYPNFLPSVILLSLTLCTGIVMCWHGFRRLPPEGAQDYGDAPGDRIPHLPPSAE